MTLQELSEHYQLRAQLEKDEDILYNLRMAAIPSAHPLDGMPRAPGVSDKVGALAIAIVDMEERIAYLKEQIAQQPDQKQGDGDGQIENDMPAYFMLLLKKLRADPPVCGKRTRTGGFLCDRIVHKGKCLQKITERACERLHCCEKIIGDIMLTNQNERM